MYKSLLLFVVFLWVGNSYAQSIKAGYSFVSGSKGQLPTWLWANQLGVYNQYSSAIHNFEFNASHHQQLGKSNFGIEGGTTMNLLLANENNIRFTELFGALNWKILQIKLGAFAEKENYQGLSASNGNLFYSRNARPHPRLRVGFNRFATIIPNWFSIYGFYEEGLLNDDRYVSNTHLHHKAFYFRVGNLNSIQFTWGLEHYTMWWGTHPTYGELPGLGDYFKYVTGSIGGENALVNDQLNVMGNSFGTYQLEFSKSWDKIQVSFYLSHPFEDHSGMELINWIDNLYGIYFSFQKDKPVLKGLVFEYYYTKHQSGDYHMQRQPDGSILGRGLDSYFNNGVYRSGVSYEQMSMGSPLMGPLILEDGISKGFENNSISGIHFGANGFIGSQFRWKTMITNTSNFGQKRTGGIFTYTPARKQLATLLQLDWQFPKIPVSIGASFAADHGELFDHGEKTTRLGSMLSVKWLIR